MKRAKVYNFDYNSTPIRMNNLTVYQWLERENHRIENRKKWHDRIANTGAIIVSIPVVAYYFGVKLFRKMFHAH
jgi:hypothetical protein